MNIGIIIGSTRPGRLAERVAQWAKQTIESQHTDAQITMMDLATYNLPFFDEAISPRYNPNRTVNEQGQKWLADVAAMDAFVVVSPEYNRTMPAVVKNAFDYVAFEGDKKASVIISYSGGATGGLASNMQVRQLLSVQGFNPVSSVVALANTGTVLNEAGEMSEEAKANPYGPNTAMNNAIIEFLWYAATLTAARNQK